jgi:hypothetical protein
MEVLVPARRSVNNFRKSAGNTLLAERAVSPDL